MHTAVTRSVTVESVDTVQVLQIYYVAIFKVKVEEESQIMADGN